METTRAENWRDSRSVISVEIYRNDVLCDLREVVICSVRKQVIWECGNEYFETKGCWERNEIW
ncbi:hypothetical protein M758_12G156600 [Ceratodon purpureus]|nr:hypothetical protein M758_12G156600 [Ceratodon purpureus]